MLAVNRLVKYISCSGAIIMCQYFYDREKTECPSVRASLPDRVVRRVSESLVTVYCMNLIIRRWYSCNALTLVLDSQ